MTTQSSTNKSAPSFRGVFIGINRYQSPIISNLASAVRDATALDALFSDNLGGQCTLVTNSDATISCIRQELTRLAASSLKDDVVVVAFSGHGTDTHQLVTYDTDPADLAHTALPLEELTELVSAIPARHLLVVLDCCFSGGAGAKVLKAHLVPRGSPRGVPLSTEALLTQMAGAGRLILTASTADQPAWEDGRVGHGLLTYHLVQALLGPTEVAHNGRIHLLDLLKYVTGRVKASASSAASARQEPTLRGRWDGDVLWPVFTRGAKYDALYPPAQSPPVTADIRSLSSYGLPDSVLHVWSTGLPGLNQLQQDAINEAGLMQGANVLVMAPTSSGKTMIGELAALRTTQNGGRSVFLLPTKALVNEQYDKFCRLYEQTGLRIIRATGDIADDVPAFLRGQFDIAILTYEKFAGLALTYSHVLRMVALVVIDEVQTLVDRTRGRDLEILLTLIKSYRDDDIKPQLIALSAVLGDLGGLDSWLDANLLQHIDRPVPLDEGVLDLNGRYRYVDIQGDEHSEQLIQPVYGEARARTLLVPLVQKLVADKQQVIVIRGIRGDSRGAARYLADALGLPPATRAMAELPDGDQSLTSVELRRCLHGGVAFHISDMDREERRVIEEQFRVPDSEIRVIVATTTLAQGENMPAETVIMPELSRRVGRDSFAWYTVAEYKNIAGRAGRLGLSERGRAIVLCYSSALVHQVWDHYITGTPENVRSTLLDPSADIYTLVLRVVAIASRRAEDRSVAQDDVIAVLANSFASHQARLAGAAVAFEPSHIAATLAELQNSMLLEEIVPGRVRLTELGKLIARSGLAVQSGIRVASALRMVQPSQLNTPTLVTAAQLTQEVDTVPLLVNTRGVRSELQTFVGALHRQGVAPAMINAIDRSGDPVVTAARAKKAVGCLLWSNGVPSAQLERTVMQHWRDRNAIGPVRAVTSRTRDVIDTVIGIAYEIHPATDLDKIASILPVQLELGIPAGLAPCAIAGANLQREHYLGLISEGITTLDLIAQSDDEKLLQFIAKDESRLRSLRDAVARAVEIAAEPTLDDLLPPPSI